MSDRPVAGLPAAMALDEMPRRAARAWPEHPAIHDGRATLRFAELDARVDTLAAALVGLVGTGVAIGVPAVLSADFPVMYYAVARSGNVVVTVNPYLREEALGHIIAASGMRMLFTDADLASLLATPVSPPPPPAVDLDATVCVHFTSGTTGPAKGVRQSHRNLSVNAAQVAGGHRLDHGSVLVNHLPTYHPMHLNSAVYAGATQILCPSDDTVAAIDAANRHRATRFYSLPVRLARLAGDPRLAAQRLDTVEAILSGGSALPPDAAATLRAHFGIPVTQGYGLAETSPLTHTERLDAPRPGSVGQTVAGTGCRVVDVATRAVLATGERGEIQVRGPQVMAGYLDEATPTGIDAGGWLSTGDIGYQDPDGYLFLVDRIKDVFKCDNWLVAPSEIERLAARHPAVRECVVVDHPDAYSGAVAHCFVVLRDGAGADDLDRIRESVNATVPYYQHIRYITAVDAIPRSPNGKVARRDIRAWAHRALPVPHRDDHDDRDQRDDRDVAQRQESSMVTLINQLTVTGSVGEFERVSASMSDFMSAQPGYLSHRLLRSLREPEVFVEIAEWQDAGSHQAAVRSDTFQGFVRELAGLVAKPSPGLYEDVKSGH